MRIISIIIFSILNSLNVFGDSPKCIKYELELTLQNDSLINGFFFFHGQYLYIDEKPLDSISFNDIYLDRLNIPSKTESVIIYKSIRKISLKESDNFNLYFCQREDKVKVLVKDIIKAKEISKNSCFPELDKETQYTVKCPPVITELTNDEIEKLELKKPFLSFEYSNMFFDDGLQYLMVFSYDKTVTEQELKDLIFQKCCSKLSNNFRWSELEENYSLLKKELKQKDIIVFRVNSYN